MLRKYAGGKCYPRHCTHQELAALVNEAGQRHMARWPAIYGKGDRLEALTIQQYPLTHRTSTSIHTTFRTLLWTPWRPQYSIWLHEVFTIDLYLWFAFTGFFSCPCSFSRCRRTSYATTLDLYLWYRFRWFLLFSFLFLRAQENCVCNHPFDWTNLYSQTSKQMD